jgi:tripartite-type tricarboxylate transporter receptor subunit TctC
MEQLKYLAKVDILHVPYKGVAPATAAVTAGEVSIALTGSGTARGQIQSGRIKALAIMSPTRALELPNVPTVAELGYPEIDGTVWWGFAAPAKTPTQTINRIHEAISRVLEAPETRQILERRSLGVSNLGPQAFAKQIAQEHAVRGEAARRLGLKAD